MESIEFLLILAVGVCVAAWYFFNEEAGADGERGLLALKPEKNAKAEHKSRSRYRIKPRKARRPGEGRSREAAATSANAAPAYRERSDHDRALRRFRRQDEARYRVKDKNSGAFDLRDP